jgi:membrane protein involved in colicin uptake
MAAGQMAAAADAAKANANAATVGDTFGNLSQAYLTNQVLKSRYPNGLPQPSSGYSTSVFNPGGGNYGRVSR